MQDEVVKNYVIADYISTNQSKLFILPKFPVGLIGQYKMMRRILRDHHYDYVHIHMNAAVNPVPLLLSFCIKDHTKFILHSHNTSSVNLIGQCLHHLNSKLFIRHSTIKLACSELAGKWMFGNSRFEQIDNAVDIDDFSFNSHKSEAIRNELNINPDTIVIGNVGRFVQQKNHTFLIEWFSYYSKTHPNTVLLLVGDGPLLSKVKSLVIEKNITDRVIFTGLRNDTPAVLSAMDCFVMPSFHEGLAFTAIEAQTSGLHVVASESITRMINIGGYCTFVSLQASFDQWSKAVDRAIMLSQKENRLDNPVKGSQFDLDMMIAQIKKVYTRFS